MRLGIVAQRGNDRAAELSADLAADLAADGVTVRLDEGTADAVDHPGVPVAEMATYPLVVSVGGDGTFLYTARHVGSTPILGVNLGEVGFLNAASPGEAGARVREEVERIRETGSPRYREVSRIEATGEGLSLPPAVNEVTVQGPQRGHGQGADVEVRVDGALYASGHADGVLVATPTGSTAYNLSEGGPLVHPAVPGLVVTEMAGGEPMPPLVVPEEVVVASDGSERQWVEAPASVTIRRAEEPARIAGPSAGFFRALNKIE